MAATKFKLQVTGVKELRAKLKEDALYRPQVRAGLEEMGKMAASAGASAAPSGKTGALGGSVAFKLSGSQTLLKASIIANAKHGGYPYARLLEYSAKYHHKGWLIGSLRAIQSQLEGVLARIAQNIEKDFGGGSVSTD